MSEKDTNEESSIVGRSYTLKITLDDLTSDATRFVSLYGEKNSYLKSTNTKALRAGTALNIKVTVRSENHKVDGLFTQYDTNSLFADKSTSENAAIYYGRHLQNLDQESGVAEDIKTAKLGNSIHFESRKRKKKMTPLPGTAVTETRRSLQSPTRTWRALSATKAWQSIT